jgi:hypothetical protein
VVGIIDQFSVLIKENGTRLIECHAMFSLIRCGFVGIPFESNIAHNYSVVYLRLFVMFFKSSHISKLVDMLLYALPGAGLAA